MRGTVDATSYDRFDYRDFDRSSSTLENAITEAAELRKRNPDTFYRVVPTDENETKFAVDALSANQVYADVLHRLWSRWVSLTNRNGR